MEIICLPQQLPVSQCMSWGEVYTHTPQHTCASLLVLFCCSETANAQLNRREVYCCCYNTHIQCIWFSRQLVCEKPQTNFRCVCVCVCACVCVCVSDQLLTGRASNTPSSQKVRR